MFFGSLSPLAYKYLYNTCFTFPALSYKKKKKVRKKKLLYTVGISVSIGKDTRTSLSMS